MSEADIEIIPTERFGEIRIPRKEIVHFPEGLLGFAERKHFIYVQEAAYAPFLWMQSVDDPRLCFVVVDPLEFMPDYSVEVKPSEINGLELSHLEQARVLVMVVVREDPSQITANLQGPLIINPATCTGKQVVLLTDRYHTRHYILQEADRHGAELEERKGN
jgi:flagellar assembly factor FliW